MNPPSLRVLILGHPLALLLIASLEACLAWNCYLDATNGTVFLAAAGCWLLWRSLKDFDVRRRHHAWRRDCMAMAGETPSRPAKPRPLLLGVVVLIALLSYLVCHSDRPQLVLGVIMDLGITMIGVVVAIALVVALGRHAWRLQRSGKAQQRGAVTVVVRKPAVTVPSLQRAYRSLPAYCVQLIKERP